MKKHLSLLLVFFIGYVTAHAQIITTVAGSDSFGYNGDNKPATTATLASPSGVTIDRWGSVYIADYYNYRVRKVDTLGIITTIAGNGNPFYNGDSIPAIDAQLGPGNIAVDSQGNVFIADIFNYRIRKINTAGIITTIAGTGTAGYNGDTIPATMAQLISGCMVHDAKGNLYIADGGNNRIRRVDTAGIITTIAGTGIAGYSGDGGPAVAAQLSEPVGEAIDDSGNIYIYIYIYIYI